MYAGAAGGLLENARKPLLRPGWESQALEGSAGHRPSPWSNTMEQDFQNMTSRLWHSFKSIQIQGLVWNSSPPHVRAPCKCVPSNNFEEIGPCGASKSSWGEPSGCWKLARTYHCTQKALLFLSLVFKLTGKLNLAKKKATRAWPGNPYSFNIWVLIVLHSQRTVSMEYWI